jgi:hypothetical protein
MGSEPASPMHSESRSPSPSKSASPSSSKSTSPSPSKLASPSPQKSASPSLSGEKENFHDNHSISEFTDCGREPRDSNRLDLSRESLSQTTVSTATQKQYRNELADEAPSRQQLEEEIADLKRELQETKEIGKEAASRIAELERSEGELKNELRKAAALLTSSLKRGFLDYPRNEPSLKGRVSASSMIANLSAIMNVNQQPKRQRTNFNAPVPVSFQQPSYYRYGDHHHTHRDVIHPQPPIRPQPTIPPQPAIPPQPVHYEGRRYVQGAANTHHVARVPGTTSVHHDAGLVYQEGQQFQSDDASCYGYGYDGNADYYTM